MEKEISFDTDEIQLLAREIGYLIEREKRELERLMRDRKLLRIHDEKSNAEFIADSKEMLRKLEKIYSKLTRRPASRLNRKSTSGTEKMMKAKY